MKSNWKDPQRILSVINALPGRSIASVAGGFAAGVVVGLLMAPRAGRDLREAMLAFVKKALHVGGSESADADEETTHGKGTQVHPPGKKPRSKNGVARVAHA